VTWHTCYAENNCYKIEFFLYDYIWICFFRLVMWVYLIESPFCLSRTHFNLCLFSPKTHFWSTMFTCLVYFTYDMIFGQIISEPDAFEQYHIWRQSRIHTAHTFAYIKKLTLRKTNFNVERPKDKNHINKYNPYIAISTNYFTRIFKY